MILGPSVVVLAIVLISPSAPKETHPDVGDAKPSVKASPTQAPTQAPTPSPVSYNYSGGVLSATQVASYARQAGFPEEAIPTMVAFAFRESRFDPRAVNVSSGACGLWQLYPCPGPEYLDPAVNARGAYAKYEASGFSPWGG